jgi:hypothetical protein
MTTNYICTFENYNHKLHMHPWNYPCQPHLYFQILSFLHCVDNIKIYHFESHLYLYKLSLLTRFILLEFIHHKPYVCKFWIEVLYYIATFLNATFNCVYVLKNTTIDHIYTFRLIDFKPSLYFKNCLLLNTFALFKFTTSTF